MKKILSILLACCLLAGTDSQITDIAMLCGFNDVSYFTRAF